MINKKFNKKKLISRLEYFIDIENEINPNNNKLVEILIDLKKYIVKNDTRKIKYVVEQLNFIK